MSGHIDNPISLGLGNTPFLRFVDITGVLPGLMLIGDSLTAVLSELPTNPTMIAVGSALVNQALPGPGAQGEPNDSPLMKAAYQYANTFGERHEFADTSIGDEDSSRSWSVNVCFRTLADADPANNGQFLGKIEASGDIIGWELQMSTAGAITFSSKGADLQSDVTTFNTYNNASGQHRYANAQWHWAGAHFDIGTSKIRTATEHEGTMTEGWTTSSLSTATELRVGSTRAFAAGPIQIAAVVWSYGDQAVADDPHERCLRLAEDTHLVIQLGHRGEGE